MAASNQARFGFGVAGGFARDDGFGGSKPISPGINNGFVPAILRRTHHQCLALRPLAGPLMDLFSLDQPAEHALRLHGAGIGFK